MNKNVNYVLLVVLVAFAACQPGQVSNEPLTIALVTTLSGEGAGWGVPVKDGFEYDTDTIIAGIPVKIIVQDDRCDAKSGLNAITQAVVVEGADIVAGTVCSSVAFSAADVMQENNVLYIATGATHPDVTSLGPNVFRLWAGDDYEAIAVAQKLAELNIKTAAVTEITDEPFGPALSAAFQSAFTSEGGEVVTVAKLTATETDFRSTVLKLKQENPEAIFLVVSSEQGVSATKQLFEQGYEGTVFLYSPTALAEGVADQLANFDVLTAVPKDVRETGFWSSYEQQAGEKPTLLHAAGYDSYKLIELGIKQCGRDVNCMQDYFVVIDGFASSRGFLRFDNNGNLVDVQYEVQKVSA